MADARHAYERAAFKFLPQDRCNAKIALALILEEEGSFEEAKKIYTNILGSSKFYIYFKDKVHILKHVILAPNHVETILNYLHFERRQDPSAFENSIKTFISSNQMDESAKVFFTIQFIRFLQQVRLSFFLKKEKIDIINLL